jgi:putative aldouronate transport system permease protein
VAKAFFQATIPLELLESASMDRCSNIRFFFKIALPLSLPLVAVITVFTAVGHWNSYFAALIYLRSDSLYPLQLVLREILIQQDVSRMLVDIRFMENQEERLRMRELIKYGVIIFASLPLLVLYPFLQRYFVKGVMVGSLKG